MKLLHYSVFIALFLGLASTGFRKEKPKVLIIGDSISIGYTPFVKQALTDRATVMHNPGNAEHSGTGVKKIAEWVGNEDWQIIQLNWGLWDLCYRHPDAKTQGNRDKINGKLTNSVADYAANLDSVVTYLHANTNAKLIFVATTCVPEAEAGRFTDDVPVYNAAAKAVMQRHGIPVNDIYEASVLIHATDGKGSDDVHYTAQGYEKLSRLITPFLEQELP